MQLHRASTRPEWETVPVAQRNWFQRLAAATRGIATLANLVTLLGFILSAAGIGLLLAGSYWWALGLLGLGRLLDIIDGLAAELTGTKSPLGEALDATIDKIITIATLIAVIVAMIAPWWLIGALALPQLLALAVVYIKSRRSVRIHPTRPGKLGMFFAWLALGGMLLNAAVGGSQALNLAIYTSVAIASLLGLYAVYQYSRAS